MAGRVTVEALRAALLEAENELEDVQLFRPRPDALATARQRVLELRAALATATVTPPEAPAPPAVPEGRTFSERLADAWVAGDARALEQSLTAVDEDSIDELRLAVVAAADRRLRRRLLQRLRELQPEAPTPPRPHPVLVVPPTTRELVDLRDGLTAAERAVLLALQVLGALPGRPPGTLRAVERVVANQLGESDPLLGALGAAVGALSSGAAPLLASSSALLSLTPLATLLLPPSWSSPHQPLPVRVPYFLLRGRLGHCELELPFDGASAMLTAMEVLLGPTPRRLRCLVGEQRALDSPRGTVWLGPTLEVEFGRQERRGQIVVRALPSLVSWSRALAHLQALLAVGALEGVSRVELLTTPARVTLVADLEHVVFSEAAQWALVRALTAVVEVDQQALVDGERSSVTPARALDAFLEHRLAVEVRASWPRLAQLAQRLELLEGHLLAEELGDALTRVLRRCDAGTVPVRWVLEHFSSCHTHPELRSFEPEASRWGAALGAVKARLTARLGEDWRPAVPLAGGFSSRQAAALENGRAALQRDDRLLTDFLAAWSELHDEHLEAEREAVRRRVRMDLDTILTSHFRR